MTVGTLAAMTRMQSVNIVCTSPPRVNVCVCVCVCVCMRVFFKMERCPLC
jgi:hypothetical protein